MQKRKGSAREISFFSKKCGCVISVFGSEARSLAEKLEKDDGVLKYESRVRLQINPPEISLIGIRSTYLKEDWVSDFFVETIEGDGLIIEAIAEAKLDKKAEIEKLELSRRYWSSKGIKWKLYIVEDSKRKGMLSGG